MLPKQFWNQYESRGPPFCVFFILRAPNRPNFVQQVQQGVSIV